MSVDDPVRTFLGLGPTDPLAPVAVGERRAGLARAFRAGDLDSLKTRPQVEHVLPELPFALFRLKREPDVVVVAVEALTSRAGAVERWPGGYALDGRGGIAMARWSDGEVERAVVNDHGRVSVFALPAPGRQT